MLSSDINENHQGGEFTATISGTMTGIVRGPGWTELQVDVGLPGGSLVQLRLTDDDPIEVEATEVEQPLNPAPPPPELDDDESTEHTDDDGETHTVTETRGFVGP